MKKVCGLKDAAPSPQAKITIPIAPYPIYTQILLHGFLTHVL